MDILFFGLLFIIPFQDVVPSQIDAPEVMKSSDPNFSDSTLRSGPRLLGGFVQEKSTSQTRSTSGQEWKVGKNPVFRGQFGVASDPTVIRHKSVFRMYYTGLNPRNSRTVLCLAESQNGRDWSEVKSKSWIKGLILEGRDGKWDENLESAFVLKHQGKYLLYYSGYRDKGDPLKGFPASLGMAISEDGITFKRLGTQPILKPIKNGYDAHAVYSPVVVHHRGEFYMVYCGHCYESSAKAGVRLLGAKSSDGIRWQRIKKPVLQAHDVGAWARDGVAEPALVFLDGTWHLYFTSLKGEERWIGHAQSNSPHGPWQVTPDPIIRPTKNSFANHLMLAPTLLKSGGKLKMWLLGTNQGSERIQIGLAEKNLVKKP